MDIEQGKTTVQVFNTCAETIEMETQNTVNVVSHLYATWSGNSQRQFDGLWEELRQKIARQIAEVRELALALNHEIDELIEVDRNFG